MGSKLLNWKLLGRKWAIKIMMIMENIPAKVPGWAKKEVDRLGLFGREDIEGSLGGTAVVLLGVGGKFCCGGST